MVNGGLFGCRSLPRQGASYFVLKQSNQNSSQQKCFFAARGPPCKTAKTGAGKFYPFASPLIPLASVESPYTLQPHRPPLFYPFSAEAYLLSGDWGSY